MNDLESLGGYLVYFQFVLACNGHAKISLSNK